MITKYCFTGNGLNKVLEHIYDFRIKQFYTIEQIQNLYNIPQNDFLKYHNIVSNIKSEWKSKLKNEECNLLPQIENKVLQIITEQKGSINRRFYNIRLNALKVPAVKAEDKWANEFPQQHLNWPQYYQMSFNCTVDVKLRNF